MMEMVTSYHTCRRGSSGAAAAASITSSSTTWNPSTSSNMSSSSSLKVGPSPSREYGVPTAGDLTDARSNGCRRLRTGKPLDLVDIGRASGSDLAAVIHVACSTRFSNVETASSSYDTDTT
jgi:hypothetical protein